MEFSHADGLQVSESFDGNYNSVVNIPHNAWWDSLFGIDRSKTTGDQAPAEPATAALGSKPSPSNSMGHLSSLVPSIEPYFTGSCSTLQAIQSKTGIVATCNADFLPCTDGPSNTFSPSSTFDLAVPYQPLGAIGMESTGHESALGITTQPDQSFGIRCGLDQQSQTPSSLAQTNECHMAFHNLLSGSDGSTLHNQQHPDTSDALAVNRAGCYTSDHMAEPYLYSFENHQSVQQPNGAQMDECEAALVKHRSSTLPERQRGHQFRVCPINDPSSPMPNDPTMASASTDLPTSTSATSPRDDSWKCDKCGTVLKTKGSRNLTRNKRRHHCPGTGPKYPCPRCQKSFNRGDSRLLHLRKWHPETQVDSPRPRKRNIR